METSVKAAEVIVAPQPDAVVPSPDESSESQAVSPPAAQAAAQLPGPGADPMEELGRRLEDILNTYGSADSLMDKQTVVPEIEKMEAEPGDDVTVTKETGWAGNNQSIPQSKESSLVIQSLNKLSSPDEKLETLVKKYTELAEARRCDDRAQRVLQQKVSVLLREREQLQAELQRGVLARSKLEGLCRELQRHNKTIKEETLQRCREDEEKRKEITSHFQKTLTDIQAQIEQHSNRNNKLCQENSNLADKLESLMHQYEQREESLTKINHHRDLQQKLSEAKLEQSNTLLVQAEEKHKREKEYLLVQAAHWKLEAQQLTEQGTVMQAQLTLYSQKFDEFQATLAKSNDIYVSFKQEMDKMTKKMKKLENESGVWKSRFESCNKTLAEMIQERAEKGKEFELFVLKIQKLEVLCRTLQEERKCLYDKIKDVRNSGVPPPVPQVPSQDQAPVPGEAPESAILTAGELQELQDIQEADPVLTEDMVRLRAEQARLQEFAASLLAPSADTDDDDDDNLETEEDAGTTAFVQFKPETQVQKNPSELISAPEQLEAKPAVESVSVESVSVEPVLQEPVTEPVKAEEVQKPVEPAQEDNTQLPSETLPVSEPVTMEPNQPAAPEPEEAKVPAKVSEVQQPTPVVPLQEVEAQQQSTEPLPAPEPTPVGSEEATPSGSKATPKEAVPAPSQQQPVNGDSSKKQASKKKKRNSKKAS
ncbi:beta-taxilin isoform 2-T3 [Polymixia lowei]